MWQRTLGLLLILMACVVCGLNPFPQNPLRYPDWHNRVIDAPFSTTQPTQIRFTPRTSARYTIALSCPSVPPTDPENGKYVGPQFSCVVREGAQPIGVPWNQSPGYNGSAGMYLLRSFSAEVGHTYTVIVAATVGGRALQQHNPRLHLLPDPNQYYHPMIEAIAALCAGVFLGVSGLLLTFWGSSHIPLCGWHRHKAAP